MSAMLAVHQAMYTTLTGDSTLMGLVTRVYNDAPDTAETPYVLITKTREVPWHTFGGPSAGLGWKVHPQVYTFTRYAGDRQALTIHNRIIALLNFASIAVSGYTSALWEYEKGQIDVKDIRKLESHFLYAQFCVSVHQ